KKQRSERTQITQDEVLRDLQELRDMCMGRKSVIVTDTVKSNQEGTIKAVDNAIFMFEPSGANKALELLGKHLGMFKDRIDMTTNGESLQPTIITRVIVDPNGIKD
ncbi:terminase small subunit, partial [Actinobacillus seminis]